MAEVRYTPASPRPPRPLPPPRAEPSEAETQYREARAQNEKLRVRERELRMAKAKSELIPREVVLKQASFLVLSLRARLLAIVRRRSVETVNIFVNACVDETVNISFALRGEEIAVLEWKQDRSRYPHIILDEAS